MKNSIILHQWDYTQWNFLFGTDGKIFSQKEFFVWYSRIYLRYSLEKMQSFIFSSFQPVSPTDFGVFPFGSLISQEQLSQDIPEQGIILVLSQKNLPDLTQIDTNRTQTLILDDTDFLAQVEPEWSDLRKKIEEISPRVILLHLWIARIVIASRLRGYGRDFIDISGYEKKVIPVRHEENMRKQLKKHLLKLWLYSIAIKSFQLLWKVFKKK